jgi:hypothetical protein
MSSLLVIRFPPSKFQAMVFPNALTVNAFFPIGAIAAGGLGPGWTAGYWGRWPAGPSSK